MIEFHELALAEARQAQGWYADRSERVALRFRSQLDEAIARVVASGMATIRVDGWPFH